MNLFMGIEAIASGHCRAVLSDDTGTVLSTGFLRQSMSLHTTDRGTLRQRLVLLLSEVLSRLNMDLGDLATTTVCVGMSGVTVPYNEYVDIPDLFNEIRVSPRGLICKPDTHIVFASHARSTSGSVIICTMGSMAFVAREGEAFRVGGWGPAIGDEGSGYWMGRAVLRAIAEEVDRRQTNSLLWKEVDQFLCEDNKPFSSWVSDSIAWSHLHDQFFEQKCDLRTAIFSFAHDLSLRNTAEWRSFASSLVVPLMSAWRKEDKTARSIVDQAAQSMASQFRETCQIAGVRANHGPLVLYGGVFSANPDFRTFLHEIIQHSSNANVSLIVPGSPGTMNPVYGALLLALGEPTNGRLALPRPEIIRQVQTSQHNVF